MKTYKPYLILLFITILFFTLFFINFTSQKIMIGNPNSLSDGWIYENEEISLPTDLNISKDTIYRIEYVLNEDFHEPKVLMIRSSLQDIHIYLEDVLIYEKVYGSSLDQPYASTWHFITLPRHIDGQTLSIELSSPYKAMSGQINEVFYGTEAMHYSYLFRTYGLRLLIGVIVLVMGLIVMISDFFIRKKQDKGYAYAGLFAVILSLWMIAESRMLQFFTGSELLLGTLAYLTLPLFAIPMVIYLTEYVLTDYKNPLKWMNILYILNFIVITTLHFTGVADYFETVIFSQIWLALGIIVAITSLILDYKKTQHTGSLKFIKAFIVLIVFAIFEFLNFLLGRFENTSLFISLGIVVLMVYLFINYVRFLVERLKISYQMEVYEKLAYMDYVTQGKNRLAFERDLDTIYQDEELKTKLRLVLFDLDSLKKINDEYGHVVGDEAIKKAFDIINETFDDEGECYRIGGDEFACIYLNVSDEVYQTKIVMVERLSKQFDDKTLYHFGLSLGSSVIESDLISQKDLYNLADLKMYEYKKAKKKV